MSDNELKNELHLVSLEELHTRKALNDLLKTFAKTPEQVAAFNEINDLLLCEINKRVV